MKTVGYSVNGNIVILSGGARCNGYTLVFRNFDKSVNDGALDADTLMKQERTSKPFQGNVSPEMARALEHAIREFIAA